MIIQGSNEPIVIKFESPYSVADMSEISIVLCNHSTTLVSNKINIFKRWTKSQLTISTSANTISCPLTQEETMLFAPGKCQMEVKWLSASSGYVQHLSVAELEIAARCDEEILGGD